MADLYVPMDVNFDEHPAILACSIEAEAVYQRALRLSKRLMTDGLIVHAHARRLTWDLDTGSDVFKELEQHGLVVAVDDGWLIGGYLERNPSRDEIESKREAEKERKRQWRQRKDAQDGDSGQEPPATDCPAGTDEDATPRDPLQRQSHRKDTVKSGSGSRPAFKIALDRGWDPSEASIEWAYAAGYTDLQVRRQVGRFIDMNLEKRTKFRDIDHAWRSWMRRETPERADCDMPTLTTTRSCGVCDSPLAPGLDGELECSAGCDAIVIDLAGAS